MPRRTRRNRCRRAQLAALGLCAAAAAALAAPALGAKDDVVLISRGTGSAGAPVDAGAFSPSISAIPSTVFRLG